MKETKKGLLHILLAIVVLAALSVVAIVGIGRHHKGSMQNIKLGLDLAGGVSITYQAVGDTPTKEKMDDTVYKIQKRVQGMNTESAVYQEGNNRINVDIPGVTDANAILEQLGKAGSIEFRDSDNNLVITGADIANAEAAINQGDVGNSYVVNLTLNTSGAKKFGEATSNSIGKQIAIVYDGEIIQNPTVQSAIMDGKAQISGQSSFEEAENLASIIRIGALPLELQEIRSNVVGAKLGAEAVQTSLLAGVIGFVIVIIFMIAFYRIPGLASGIALALYVALMLVVLNVFDVTLTLPGIAGIILSIGMAVDANVIIFTRIKEEIASGKTVRSSIKLGFSKALSAIVDGNVTTLIAAAVLWIKGSGTVKGFAQTLAIGIILSMFTALVITKFLVNAFYKLGFEDIKYYGVQKEKNPLPFVKHTPKFAIISAVLIGIGIVAMVMNTQKLGGLFNYGLDFKGGTSTEITFDGSYSDQTKADVTELIKDIIGETPEISEVKGENALLIKSRELNLAERTEIANKLQSDFGVLEGNIATESISGNVSNEMKSDAVVALLIATICMLIYIWIRFKDISFGMSAVLALVHDVLVVLMVYAVIKIPVGNTFIACVLTIVGYSINATIVIFDRIRENRATMRNKDELSDIVNNSITQTISRSINTSLTTFIMVFVIWLLGVESIKEFALPLMAGILCGAYSSICIAGTLWYFMKSKLSKGNAK